MPENKPDNPDRFEIDPVLAGLAVVATLVGGGLFWAATFTQWESVWAFFGGLFLMFLGMMAIGHGLIGLLLFRSGIPAWIWFVIAGAVILYSLWTGRQSLIN